MADQSNFSRFPKKQLVFIANKLIEDEFEWDDITHTYEDIYDSNEDILKQVSTYFNESVVEEDVQFFIKFLEINSGLLDLIFKNNDIEKFDASCISIKNEFRAFSLPEIFDMVLTSKDCLEGIVKDTLRFVGRSNEGQPKEKIEW